MEPDMQSMAKKLQELTVEKYALLRDKSFEKEDTGDLYPREALYKIHEFLNLGLQKISHTLNKMTILLSERPLPKSKDMTPLFNELSEEINQYYEICTSFYPIYCGTLLKEVYRQACLDAMEAIGEVVNEILTDVYNNEKLLVANSFVWQTIIKIQALPRDLIQLCVQRCQTEYESLVDAEEELKNEIKEHQESPLKFDQSTWSEEDQKLLTPAVGLIKVCHSLIKKVKPCVNKARLENKEEINDIDRVCRGIMGLSPGVDDLVTYLYPPLFEKPVHTSATTLLASITALIDLLPSLHFISQSDNKWIDFLRNATQHNGDKLFSNLACGTTNINKQMDGLNIT